MGSAADTLPKELNLGDGFNRYKFQSFRNRIEKLDVHVARRVVRNLDEPKDDTGSYFGEALASWIELNCTSDFTSFCREVRPITTSLAQLLYHKDTVVDAVEKHITKPGSLALEPLLSLTTSLAQDLQEEFYPYYLRCMGWLIPLARSPDAAVVEWVYNTIAYLFKYLTKTILTDFNTTFLAISPLLGSERQKSHAKRFAAESLSYLLRKLKGKELQSAIGFIVHSLVESSSVTIDGYCEGLALLFFECMKNVDRQLHSKAPRIFQVLLEELYKEDLEPAKPSNNHVFRLAETTWKLCLHYVKPDGSEPLWRVVYQDFDRATGKGHDSEDATNETRLLSIVSLFATGAALRKADRVDDVSQLATRAERCLDIYFGLPNMPDGEAARTNVTLMGELARLVAALLLHSPLDTVLSSGRLLLDRIFATGDARIVLSLSTTLVTMKWQHTSQLLLPHLVRYIGDNWQTSLEEILLLLLHLRQFSDFGIPAGTPSTVLSPSGQIMFPSLSAKRKKGLKTAERHGTGLRPSTDVSGAFIELLRADVDWADQLSGLQRLPPLPFEVQPMFNPTNEGPLFATASKIPTYVCLLSVLSMVSLDHGLLCDALAQFNLKLIQAVATFCADKIEVEKTNSNEQCVYWGSGSQVFPLVSLLGLGLRALGQSASQVPPASSIATLLSQWKRVVPTVLSSCPTNVTLLDGLACVGSRVRATLEIDHSGQIPVSVRAEVARLFSLDEFMELLPVFEANLSSFQHSIRLSTLKLMELFEQERFKPSDNSKEEDLVSPVSLLRSMEEIPATLESYREKANILRRLAVAVSNGRLPARYNRAFTLTTTSQLAVNLSLFWPEAVKALSAVADKLPDLFWDAVWHQLARLNDKVLLVEASLTPQSNNMYSRLQQHFGESFSHKQLPQLEGHHVECPFAYKLQSVYKRSEELFEPGLLSYQLAWHAIATSTPPNDRVDYWNVRVLLLKVLSEAGPSVAENHTKQLDPMFLDFVKTDMRINLDDRSNENDDDGEDVDEDGGDWSGSPDSTTDPDFRLLLPQSRKNAEKLLFGFLTLYSKFQHPEKGCEARRIYGLYLRLLMKGQPKLQCLALDCVLSWNDPAIKPYGENLKHLLDEIKFRDELHTFSLDPQGEAIHPEHREKLMPILLRILYGRIIL
ncbi:U3 snoRNP protein, partial [Spiromyces aspiralis]